MDRPECSAELEIVKRELEAIGESWRDIYAQIVSDVEARAEFASEDDE